MELTSALRRRSSASTSRQRQPAGNNSAAIAIDHLSYTYPGNNGTVLALSGIDLAIGRNEFFAVVGPSGCGKSTLLKIVAGLLDHASGSVLLNGSAIHGPGLDRGVVFQEPALFPWMNVQHNLEFGLRNAGWSKERADARAKEVLDIVGLVHCGDRYPYQLSGGQAQRVAVARAWALSDASVLLMDEPFAAVDPITKTVLQDYLVRTWSSEPRTVLYITHDIEEAVYMADRIALMNASPGRIDRIFDVDLPRPRDRTSNEAVQLRRVITSRMKELLGYE